MAKDQIVKIGVVAHPNATIFKMKNKRLNVISFNDSTFAIEFKALVEKGTSHEPRCKHKSVGDSVVITGIRISLEAATALCRGLEIAISKRLEIKLGDMIRWSFGSDFPEHLRNKTFTAKVEIIDRDKREYGVYAEYGQDLISFELAEKCN